MVNRLIDRLDAEYYEIEELLKRMGASKEEREAISDDFDKVVERLQQLAHERR